MTETNTLTCKGCLKDKPLDEFYRQAYGSTRRRQPCQECYRSVRRKTYPVDEQTQAAESQLLKDVYGLTIEEFHAMIEAQDNRCAICDRTETARIKSQGPAARPLFIDFDPGGNRIPGLICLRCSTIISAIRDGCTTLPQIQAYLEGFQAYLDQRT